MDPELLDLLQEQLNVERGNHSFYLAMSWALEAAQWPGCAAFLAKAAGEELEHSHKIARFIIDRSSPDDRTRPEYGAIQAPEIPGDYMPLDYFQAAYEAERANTERLTELQLKAEEVKDRQAYNFLDWFLNEQTASEGELSDIITELQRAGSDIAALQMLDEKYAEQARG